MPLQGFLADNELRAYPFLPGVVPTMTRSDGAEIDLPTSAIVDFRCVVGLDAGWAEGLDVVYLHAARREHDGSASFEFRSTAIGLAGLALVFRRDADDPEFTSSDADATTEAGGSLNSSLPPSDCGDTLIWSGRLTTGLPGGLTAVLAPGQGLYAADGLMAVERASVQDLAGTYVRSVNLANVVRPVASAPAGCASSPPQHPPGTVVPVATCLTGPLTLKEGFNVSIQQNDPASTITLTAGVGAGAGQPCDEVPLYPGEAPPAGSTLLTGGPSCGEVVTSINGLSGAVLRLTAGSGVTIAPDPVTPHAVAVTVGLVDLVSCPAFVDSIH